MKAKVFISIFFLPFLLLAQSNSLDLLSLQFKADIAKYQQLFTSQENALLQQQNNIHFSRFGHNGFPSYKTVCTNINLANTVSSNKVWPGGVLGLNLTGNGLNKLGIWDGGAIRTTHKEFIGRVTQMDTNTVQLGHANNVAGIMVANGVFNSNAKGIAYQSLLKAWVYDNDVAEMGAAAPHLLVSNHAYADLAAWFNAGSAIYWLGDTTLSTTKDWQFGFYDNTTKQWDSIAYANPNYLIVKAVGNDRGNRVAPGTPHFIWNGSTWVLSTATRDTVGPYDCVVTYGTAKNILSVGAVPVQTNGFVGAPINTFSYSSWGPTDDGRIKPDIVTGTGTTATPTNTHDSAYTSLGGTSGASAAASGSLYLLQQHYLNTNNKPLKAASLKALAIHTADNCKTTLGPNYESGWGLLNTAKAAQLISDSAKNMVREHALNNTDTFRLVVYVNGSDTAKITLAWTDPAANPRNPALNDTTPRLVNDLDLRLIRQANNQVYQPYVLNPNNPSAAATTGDNFRDNVEQIYVTGLPAGFYTIRITHKNALLNALPQAFSIIGSGFIASPQIPSSNIVLANFSTNNAHFRINSFTKGNGSKRLIVANSNGPVNALPSNGVSYTAKDTFGLGSQIGTGNYVVYNGTANSMLPIYNNIVGTPTYHIAIFDYNGDSNYTLYNTNQFATSSITLPVKWLAIGAQLINNTVQVNWRTASETNNMGFDIERSFDNQSFQKIAFVNGAGNSFATRAYQYTDELLDVKNVPNFGNKIYYRLKQIDIDGAFMYSKTVSADAPLLANISIYPNPFNETFNVQINASAINQKGTIQGLDVMGRELFNKTFVNNNLQFTLTMDDLKLANDGIYFVKITLGTKVYTLKALKAR